MSAFEGLEVALDEAAHRHYGRRRRLVHRPAMVAGALTVACATAVFVLAISPPQTRPPAVPAHQGALTVPEATLAQSRALTAAGAQPQALVEHAALAATAAELGASIPYPPGAADTFDWQATPDDRHDMASINYRNEVEGLLDYRAACLWVSFWVFAYARGDAGALTGATTVLRDVRGWPAMRANTRYWDTMAAHATARDPGPLRTEDAGNCRSVQVPWR